MNKLMHQRRSWLRLPLVILLIALVTLWACQKVDTKDGDKGDKGKKDKKEKREKDKLPVDKEELTSGDFHEVVKKIRASQQWDTPKHFLKSKVESPAGLTSQAKLKLSEEILNKSFAMGADYLLANQKPEGNFNYQYDWVKKTWATDDNQVRQAGALWGVALNYQYQPSEKGRQALEKGLEFWLNQTIPGPDGSLTVRYKQDGNTGTGTISLVALTIIEYLRTNPTLADDYRAKLVQNLTGYLNFIRWLQMEDGHFADGYFIDRQQHSGKSNPYYDGEALLCLCKAARYLGYTDLVPVIERAAPALAKTYTVDAWAKDYDSDRTKGFYQWGSMSFTEYYFAGWKDREFFGDVTLMLGWWMLHVHRTLTRQLNTSYAYEGIISAYRIARDRGDIAAMTELLYTIDQGLYKLTSWQINGPLAQECEFLVKNPTTDPMATGGVMNYKGIEKKPRKDKTYHELRIDVTQHQMHAVTMALEYVYGTPRLSEQPVELNRAVVESTTPSEGTPAVVAPEAVNPAAPTAAQMAPTSAAKPE